MFTIRTHDDTAVLATCADWFGAMIAGKVHAVLTGFPVTLDAPDGTSETIDPTEVPSNV